MTSGPNIIIIVPTYNERENINLLVETVTKVVPYAKILFVDDNSPDGTATLIKKLQENNRNILLIERSAKLGLGTAYIAAFKSVINNKLADIVITFDGDLTHPVQAIPYMVSRIGEYDLVIGSRYVKGSKFIGWPIHRRALSFFSNLGGSILARLPIHDITSGFLVIKDKVLANIDLDKIHSDGYAFLIELKYLAIKHNFKATEYPITVIERRAGKSKLSGGVITETVFLIFRIFFKLYDKKNT